MERVQGPLSKQAAASTHLISCYSPPRELSPPQYSAPAPNHSSQALFWNNSSNARQDLTHQASPWSPHRSQRHAVTCPESLNNLHCKEDASDGGLSPVSPLLDTTVDSATGPTHLLDECIGTDKTKSFSQSSVLGVPLSCKLDLAAAKSRTTLLASLSAHIAEAIDRTSGADNSGSFLMKLMDKPNAGAEGNVKCISAESTDLVSEAESKLDMHKQRDDAGGAPSSSSCEIGLKLGKRTYFGDARATVVGDANTAKPSANTQNGNTYNSNGANSTNAGSGGNAKKTKALSPAANVPRCQAEDCKMDLTGAKDYHRRHKVCEWHSKSSKVKVSNIDQRFCQQCSRFHVLSEFDEGKRSCRRRLAGHNERRRKQQPEPFSLVSAGSYGYFAGAKHLFGAPTLDCSYILNQDQAGAEFNELKMLQKMKVEATGNHATLELHQFLHGSLGGDEHPLLGGSAQALIMSNRNAMNIGPPPAPPTSLAACLSPDHHPETLVSGRALSLLSSSLGFPNTSSSVPGALGLSSLPCLEGNLLEMQHGVTSSPQIVSRVSCLNSPALKDNDMLRLTHSHDISMLSDSESTTAAHCLNVDQVQPSTMLAFVDSSNFPILPGSDSKNDAATRPVLDLMQMPFAASSPPQNQAEHRFADLEGLCIFGRQSLM